MILLFIFQKCVHVITKVTYILEKNIERDIFLDILYVLAVYPIMLDDGIIGHALECSLPNFVGRRQEK